MQRKYVFMMAAFLAFPLWNGTSAQAELSIGDEAPSVTLPGSDGKEYDLAKLRGKQAFVIAWYPKAFTGG